jgi:hypothetical protein
MATVETWPASLEATFNQVGAFDLTPGSHDTALLESLAPGSYTAQIGSQTSNNGVVLAEIYDADSSVTTNRLVNISARGLVGTGGNILIGGFVIEGTTSQTMVIRADGPALVAFGVNEALASPVLTLGSSGGVIATNSGWSGATAIGPAAGGRIVVQPLTAALAAKVGAFALVPGSRDAGIVATLPPGDYTVQVSGANAAIGLTLLEIYELR